MKPAPVGVSPVRLALRPGLTVSLVLAVVAPVVAGLVRGGGAALAALAGVAVVAAFFTVSVLAVEKANSIDPQLTLPVGLGVYFLKVVTLGVLVYATPLADSDEVGPFALTVIIGVIGWLVAQSVGVWRARIPYVVPLDNDLDHTAGSTKMTGR